MLGLLVTTFLVYKLCKTMLSQCPITHKPSHPSCDSYKSVWGGGRGMKFKNPCVLYTGLLISIPLSPNSCPFAFCSHALKIGRLKNTNLLSPILPKVIFRFLATTQIFSLFGTSTVGKVGKGADVCREEQREE